MARIEDATDEDLQRYRDAIDAEIKRRQTLKDGATRIDDLSRDLLTANGVKPGDEWVQPTDASNAYPKDWEATYAGKTWISLVSGNVWEPGVSAWREKVDEPGVPEFVQPTGAHDAYHTGDKVMFEGAVYTSSIDNNTWSPSAYPAGWTKD